MLTISVSKCQFLHFLANSSYSLFNFSHSNRCIVIVVIWIFVFLLTTSLNVSSSAFLSSVYLLWWSIYSNILPIFLFWFTCFLVIEFWVLFLFWIQISYQICSLQIFFSQSMTCLLSFNCHLRMEILNIDMVKFVRIFFYWCYF